MDHNKRLVFTVGRLTNVLANISCISTLPDFMPFFLSSLESSIGMSLGLSSFYFYSSRLGSLEATTATTDAILSPLRTISPTEGAPLPPPGYY